MNGGGRRGRALSLAVSLALTAGVLALVLSLVDLSAVPARLAEADLGWFGIGFAVFFGSGLVLANHRLYLLLRWAGVATSFGEVLFVRMGSLLFMALPARTGEFVPAVYLSKRCGCEMSRPLGAVVFELFSSVFVLVMLSLLGAAHLPAVPPVIPAALGLGLLAAYHPAVTRFGVRLLRLDRTRLAEPLRLLLLNFQELSLVRKALITLYVVMVHLGFLLGMACCLWSVGVAIPLTEVVLLGPVVRLVANLPLTIGGVGTREGMMLLVFGAWAEPEVLLTASAMVTAVEFVLPMAVGLVMFQPFVYRLTRPPAHDPPAPDLPAPDLH